MPIGTATAPRRKNGRRQACEPCRRRKVACDHTFPVCIRCSHGNTAEACVYLGLDRVKTTTLPRPTALQQASGHQPLNEAMAVGATLRQERRMGYLGATSFSALYEEAQEGLASPLEQDTAPGRVIHVGHGKLPLGVEESVVSLLQNIPDFESSHTLFRAESSVHDGWYYLAGETLHTSFWSCFGKVFGSKRSEGRLRRVAAWLYANSSIPLENTHTDPKMWLESFSGGKLRWESLGHLFIYWAYGARALSGSCLADQSTHRSNDRMRQYKFCASKCIELSRGSSSGNILLAYLVFKHCLLESNLSGDGSECNCRCSFCELTKGYVTGMQYWRLHGDVVSLTTFLGLHVSSATPAADSSLLQQMERRLFAAVFIHDKTLATFTGRPPFISHRFSSTPLPLDICDSALADSSLSSNSPEGSVDENGWNVSGEIQAITISRARAQLAFIRDQILEIALQDRRCGDADDLR